MIIDYAKVDLETLIQRIGRQQLDLQPEFQRGQVWPLNKKVRLVDTVLRNWYIPAIHLVINEELDIEEVLDGQQRLQALLEFFNGDFVVDGSIPPFDPQITSLNGLGYDDLPNRMKSRFKRFTIDTVRLRDYNSDEPGELFFRLNQITALTAAEQRNALIGRPRNQVKGLVNSLTSSVGPGLLGFSNVRLNYDDTLSRLAVALEEGSLSEKTTAAGLERRYRIDQPFSPFVIASIESSINKLSHALRDCQGSVRLNKASLFSWLFFFADLASTEDIEIDIYTSFFGKFEVARGNFRTESHPVPPRFLSAPRSGLATLVAKAALDIFNDRSKSRVNDTSSILLRDFALNYCFFTNNRNAISLDSSREKTESVARVGGFLSGYYSDIETRLEREAAVAKEWESVRARRAN